MRDFGVGSEPEGLLWTGKEDSELGADEDTDTLAWPVAPTHYEEGGPRCPHVISSASIITSSLATMLLSYRRKLAPPTELIYPYLSRLPGGKNGGENALN